MIYIINALYNNFQKDYIKNAGEEGPISTGSSFKTTNKLLNFNIMYKDQIRRNRRLHTL